MLWSIDVLLKKKSEDETKDETLKNMMLKTNHTDVYRCAAHHSLLWELHIK